MKYQILFLIVLLVSVEAMPNFIKHLKDYLKNHNRCSCHDSKGVTVEYLVSNNCMTSSKQILSIFGYRGGTGYASIENPIEIPNSNTLFHFRANRVGENKHEWIAICWDGECFTAGAYDMGGHAAQVVQVGSRRPSNVYTEMYFDNGDLKMNDKYDDVVMKEWELEESDQEYYGMVEGWYNQMIDRLYDGPCTAVDC